MIPVDQARVGYFCACYFGRRRRADGWDRGLENPALSFIIKQLEIIPRHLSVVSRVSFICNVDADDEQQRSTFAAAKSLVESHNADSSVQWDIFRRPNENASYGAWASGLEALGSELDYVFLVEDDYVPTFPGFDADVVQRYFSNERAQSSIIGATSVWVDDTLLAGDRHKGSKAIRQGVPHAAVSNGIVNVSVYNKVEGGFAFAGDASALGQVPNRAYYKSACDTQVCYLKPYTTAGYKVINMSQHYRIPFVSSDGRRDWAFGPPDAETLFIPVELL